MSISWTPIITHYIQLTWAPKIAAEGDCSHEIKRCLLFASKAMTNLGSILKSRDITADKGPYSQNHVFSSSHARMWELDHKEGWVPKNWCFQTVMLEKTLESPGDSKAIKSVNPKGHQSWLFIGRTDAEAPILWPPDAKSQLIRKDPHTGKDWGQEEKGVTEDEMARWHTDSMDMSLSKLWEIVKDREEWWLQFIGLQSWMWLST